MQQEKPQQDTVVLTCVPSPEDAIRDVYESTSKIAWTDFQRGVSSWFELYQTLKADGFIVDMEPTPDYVESQRRLAEIRRGTDGEPARIAFLLDPLVSTVVHDAVI